jgi:cytochrome b involved in lipid metabolism
MAIVGISLIFASVVWVIIRPPGWLPAWFTRWRGFLVAPSSITDSSDGASRQELQNNGDARGLSGNGGGKHTTPTAAIREEEQQPRNKIPTIVATNRKSDDAVLMPPPPAPPTIQPPIEDVADDEDKADGQTTPKASAVNLPQTVPSFSLNDETNGSQDKPSAPPAAPSASSMMPPPPRPAAPRPGRLPAFPAVNSAQRARGPLPNRGPGGGGGGGLGVPSTGLAPPPTHSSKPSKPSRQVNLTPGHSPLDWARISGPNADLRGVPGSTPYLRIPPSMLKKQNGRKGVDAWMALNGKVYNISPYADFHPGGVPELLRGAGKDGTKLFGEIHPWVNYETMLSACLVGLLVEEPEASQESEMDRMD